MLIDSQ